MTNHIGKTIKSNPLKSVLLAMLAVLFVIALSGATQQERDIQLTPASN